MVVPSDRLALPQGLGHRMGLAAGTMVETPRGPRAVEGLRPGAPLLSADGGMLRLRQLRAEHSGAVRPCQPGQLPLRIRAGAFGEGVPRRDLCLAPGQQVRLHGWAVEDLCGVEHLTAEAAMLEDGLAVARTDPAVPARFHSLVTDRPGFLLAEGLAIATRCETSDAVADAPPPAALMGYLARLAGTGFA
jgi:hypothetical protein